jgi:Mg-chelatase subunit ChlD
VPGDYEIRYLMGSGNYRSLGSVPLAVTGADATLDFPSTVEAGAGLEIRWQGPDNAQDFITIVPAGAKAKAYDAYVYTARGNPAKLNAPEEAGAYEVRYLTGQAYATLAAGALTVTPATATLEAPPTAPARASVDVTWEGPGNPTDYVVLLPAGSDNQAHGNYALVSRGRSLEIATPAEPGDYELRYVTAGKRLTLGKRPITIVPRPAPGELQVVDESLVSSDLSGGTVAVVLDASGSMLQRLDGRRRIDLAKAALTELIADGLPDGAAFALRVFGHKEADACRTDLEIPPAPLDRSAASARLASIEAMNLAKTPIAASLEAIAADVAGRDGPLLVILLTDGEETCDGDPAQVIRKLAESDIDVRVNIVGFAIDELMLQQTFAEWARLGKGTYFNAEDGGELTASLRQSIEVPFRVVDAAGRIVATGTINGPPISVDAGSYRVEVPGDPARSVDGVSVAMDERTSVALERLPAAN